MVLITPQLMVNPSLVTRNGRTLHIFGEPLVHPEDMAEGGKTWLAFGVGEEFPSPRPTLPETDGVNWMLLLQPKLCRAPRAGTNPSRKGALMVNPYWLLPSVTYKECTASDMLRALGRCEWD